MKTESGSLSNGSAAALPSQSNEVVPVAKRRTYTAEYKQRILTELDGCAHGERGAVLRREGLYSKMIAKWRGEQRQGLEPRKRGRKPQDDAELRKQIQRLEREKEHLARRLQQAEKIIEVQKKLSEILGLTQEAQNVRNV